MRDHVVFYVNGERHEVTGDDAGLMLADYMRYKLGLTGTKIVCAEGDCGACTILRRFPFAARVKTGKTGRRERYLAINSCVVLVAQMDGSSLVTVDALEKNNELTPVQNAMMSCHGSQCGFCTPGFVMALTGAMEKNCTRGSRANLSEKDARNALTGNLCRCTGYQQILDAAADIDMSKYESVARRFYSKAQERELFKLGEDGVHIQTPEFEFFAPLTLKDASKYLSRNRDARIIAAATDLGVMHNKRKLRLSRVLSLHLIPSLYEMKEVDGTYHFGGRVTLAEVRSYLKSRAPELAGYLDIFASPQIKNIATLAGNIANASPIADTPPALMIADAVVLTFGPKGEREIPIANFFLGYRKTALKAGELISGLRVRKPSRDEHFAVYKVSERKDLDISSVNAGVWLKFEEKKGQRIVADARIALGGVALTPVRLRRTEKSLVGQSAEAIDVDAAARILQLEINPISDVRGSAAFRRILAENLFRRFFKERLPSLKAEVRL